VEYAFDFLVYYLFSEEFVDELVWIDKDKLATARQGLYNFVKELHLNIDTIVQSWPLAKYNVRSSIPFSELERSTILP
jgi:hypothetical protein